MCQFRKHISRGHWGSEENVAYPSKRRKGEALADHPKRSVSRELLIALAERITAECQQDQVLASLGELKLRGWEVGTRFEDWRLILLRPPSRQEYQVGCWADWERLKRRTRR